MAGPGGEGIARSGRAALGRMLLGAGVMGEDWAPAFAAVDRAAFLPELMWPFDTRRQGAVAVDKAEDPDAWYAAADSDAPIGQRVWLDDPADSWFP